MKKKICRIAVLLSLVALCAFNVSAGPDVSISIEAEIGAERLKTLEDEMLQRLNHGGVSGQYSGEITREDIDFEKAYRVFSNSELFDKRTNDAATIRETLMNGRYVWQVPFFIGNDTILVNISKTTEIREDLPENIKEEVRKTLGQWQTAGISVYNDLHVDYPNAVMDSLINAGLNPELYSYEIVSGIPGIRYPVAVVSDDKEAKFIIPVQRATAAAFLEGSEEMEYAAPSSNAPMAKNNNGFAVYEFDEVSDASRASLSIGLGGGIGISPHKSIYYYAFKVAGVATLAAVGFCSYKIYKKRHKTK